jgi:hypothetical protein
MSRANFIRVLTIVARIDGRNPGNVSAALCLAAAGEAT